MSKYVIKIIFFKFWGVVVDWGDRDESGVVGMCGGVWVGELH